MNNVKILWTVIYESCLQEVTLKARWLLLSFLTAHLIFFMSWSFPLMLLLWRRSGLISPSVLLLMWFCSLRSVQEKAKCLGALNGRETQTFQTCLYMLGLTVSSDALNLNERCIFNRYLVTELFK